MSTFRSIERHPRSINNRRAGGLNDRRALITTMTRMSKLYLLKEAKCPRCGDPNAYVGLNDVECPSCDKKSGKGKKTSGKGRSFDFDLGVDPADAKKWVDAALARVGVSWSEAHTKLNPNGPGGGNPNVFVSFDDDLDAEAFEENLVNDGIAWSDENDVVHDDHA